jgi:ribose 5-phosphate isomerase B
MKPIAVGCDPNAKDLKDLVVQHLGELGFACTDYGSDDPVYANVAIRVAEAIARGDHDRGILLCGTGIGMSIAANKVTGAFAALCSDTYSAERARRSNNANIMTLGSQVIGPELARVLVTTWMNADYEPGGRSDAKVRRIAEYDAARRGP